MGIQRINIEQQLAEIGVRTTPARLKIRMPRGRLTIKNERPQLNVETQSPSFKVDKKSQYDQSGLKGPLTLARSFRDEGKQGALRGTSKAKEDGNFLALAGKDVPAEKVVPQLAKRRQMERLGPREYNIGLMPQKKPDITWNKGYIRVNWSKHSVVIDFSGDYMPDVSVEPKHSVEVYLRKKPYFRVMVEEAVSPPKQYI